MEILALNILLIVVYGFVLSHSPISAKKRAVSFLSIALFHLLFLNVFKEPNAFPDLDEYEIYFNNLSYNFSNIGLEREGDRVEWGWYFLNKFLHIIFGDNVFVLIVVMAVATIGMYMKDICMYSSCMWLSVVVLFCTNFYPSLFILRQHFAIPVCFFSIKYILNRDLKRFLFVVFIATLFHYSAIIWLFTYFIYPIKFRVKHIIYSIIVLYVLARVMELLMSNLALILPIIASYGVDAFDGAATSGGAYKPFLFDLFILLFIIIAFRGTRNMKGVNRFCLLMIYVSLLIDVFHIVGSSFAEFSRLGLYFNTCSIFVVPNAIGQIKDKVLKIVSIGVIIILYLMMLNAFCNYGYHFIF